jgi:hypothetical protein
MYLFQQFSVKQLIDNKYPKVVQFGELIFYLIDGKKLYTYGNYVYTKEDIIMLYGSYITGLF